MAGIKHYITYVSEIEYNETIGSAYVYDDIPSVSKDALPVLTSDDYKFLGWYKTSTFDEGTKVEAGDMLWDPFTLYAKWGQFTVYDRMTDIANAIRTKTGGTDTLTLAEMASELNEIQERNTSDLIVSGATITVPAGNYKEQVTSSVSTTTQATPSISVNSAGLITASTTQSAGYVSAGTKSATKQLTTQAAKTITPSTSSQTAVSSGVYTTGAVTVAAIPSSYVKPTTTKSATTYTPGTSNQTISAGTYCSGIQTIKGDSNLTTGNIKSGVSIFGVTGSYEGNTDNEDMLVSRTFTEYENNRITKIGNYAFAYYSNLTSVSFPKCTTIGEGAFHYCSNLTSASFPSCTTIGESAFQSCFSLASVSFPSCTTIGECAFSSCFSLTSVSFPKCTTLDYGAFYHCSRLTFASFPSCTIIKNGAFQYCFSLASVSFPQCRSIRSGAFAHCSSLTSLSFGSQLKTISANAFASCTKLSIIYLEALSVPSLANSNAFYNTGITSSTGAIYVYGGAYNSYKTAKQWSYFSNRIYSYTPEPA